MHFLEYVCLLQKKDRLDEQIGRLEGNLYYVHPSTLTDMPRGSLVGTDGVTDDLDKLFGLRDERDELIKKLTEVEMSHGISKFEHETVVRRDVYEHIWKQIADDSGYSVRHIQRIYNKIIEKFS